MSKIKLSKQYIYKICKEALKEDLYPSGDITSKLLNNTNKIKAKIISNSSGIIGGLDFAKQIFKIVDKKILFKIKKRDGSKIKNKQVIAEIVGNVKNILTGERVALNFLSHISGIATQTNKFVNKVGKNTKICCTRKTLPGLRTIQKYAVNLGGGHNHRFNLSDEFLIKDNHIATRNIRELIIKAQKKRKKIYGFDSFEGLKEDWLGTTVIKGTFDLKKKIPKLNSNVVPISGWIQDTLPGFIEEKKPRINFVHMDVDTYETTKFVLERIKPHLIKGAIILFDELYNFEGWDVGEYKALTEVFDKEEYKFISFSTDTSQAAIKILT